jgi:hypothetical protein
MTNDERRDRFRIASGSSVSLPNSSMALPYGNAAIEEAPPRTITSEYCGERGAPGVTCGLR